MRPRYRTPNGKLFVCTSSLDSYAKWLGDKLLALGCSTDYVAWSREQIRSSTAVPYEAVTS